MTLISLFEEYGMKTKKMPFNLEFELHPDTIRISSLHSLSNLYFLLCSLNIENNLLKTVDYTVFNPKSSLIDTEDEDNEH